MNNIITSYLASKYNTYAEDLQADVLEMQADQKALHLFYQASQRIPAYQDFLKKYHINPETITTIQEFNEVPYTSKENYIHDYPIDSRCWDGQVTSTHMLATSSGSTGEPNFWPRQIDQEIEGALIHEYLLDKVYKVSHQSTLFINAFGLGNWIAGMYTQVCLYLNRMHDVPFTLANPGYNPEEIFKVIKGFAKYYQQIILACHPPIIKLLIEDGKNHGIDWSKLNIKFLGAGEGFSENWRDYLLSLVHQTDPLTTMINIYGSADAGLMGFETPLTIALRRLTAGDHQLNQLLFSSERNPYLYQFDPRLRYLESIQGEICITMNATAPLLRYNIHDQGYILPHQDVVSVLSQQNSPIALSSTDQWPLPILYLFGRDTFMITLYGVNIYPENVKAVLEHASLQTQVSGRFLMEKDVNAQGDQYLILRVELLPNSKSTKSLQLKLHKLFIQTLRTLNSEYNQVEQKFNQKMHPVIKLHRFHHPEFFPVGKIKKMA